MLLHPFICCFLVFLISHWLWKKSLCLKTHLVRHYPIGVVFDMCADTMDIPWKITVHFSNYPSDLLLSPPVSRSAVETHFLSMIKEADALKHRSYVINQMQARDHRQLWNGLLHFRYDQFWSVNSRLMEPLPCSTKDLPMEDISLCDSPEEKPLQNSDMPSPRHKTFRYIPCRLYCVSENPSSTSTGFIQKLIRPVSDNGSLTSLKDAIEILFQSSVNSNAPNTNFENYFFLFTELYCPIRPQCSGSVNTCPILITLFILLHVHTIMLKGSKFIVHCKCESSITI
ncbi:unnamed protein product [Heterobilharzia americana]|nr:unnamed protein product [Heterobilharzia americana]